MSPITSALNTPWVRLSTNLRDLAFVLDRQGNPVAADLASTIAAQIDELIANEPPPPDAQHPGTPSGNPSP